MREALLKGGRCQVMARLCSCRFPKVMSLIYRLVLAEKWGGWPGGGGVGSNSSYSNAGRQLGESTLPPLSSLQAWAARGMGDHFTVPLRQDFSAPDPSHLAAQVHFGIQTTLDSRKGGTPCFHHLLLLISTFVASSYTTVLCRTTSSAQCHDSSLHDMLCRRERRESARKSIGSFRGPTA